MTPLRATASMIQKATPAMPLKLERRMKGNHDGSSYAGDDVKIHPVPCCAEAAKPWNDFAQSVEKDDEKQNGAQNAELEADAFRWA